MTQLKIVNQQPLDVEISLVAIHPRNPKDHDIGLIDQSFKHNGFYGRIVIWRPKEDETLLGVALPKGKQFWCIAGAGRIETARQQDATTLPAELIDVTPEVAATILLVDNKATTAGGYKPDMLYEYLAAVVATGKDEGKSPDEALAGSGYDGDDVDDLYRVLNPPKREEKSSKSDEESYLVVIECESEEEQTKTVQALTAEGYKARIIDE